MSWVPQYKIYEDDGLTLVYTFDFITGDPSSPSNPKKSHEVEGIRGQGSIVVPGSDKSWDLSLNFYLRGADYEEVIAKMDTLEDTIVMHTKYILKIGRTSSTTKPYNVMLVLPIAWDAGKRVRSQRGTITFLVNSW